MRNGWVVLAVFSLLGFSSLSVRAAAATTPRFAFVVNAGDNTVSEYTVNGTSGLLRDNGYGLTGSKPAAAAVTPNGKFLFIANSSSSNVTAYAVTATDGALAVVSGSPFKAGTGPAAAAVTPSGAYLYIANKTSGNISAYSINTTPAL